MLPPIVGPDRRRAYRGRIQLASLLTRVVLEHFHGDGGVVGDDRARLNHAQQAGDALGFAERAGRVDHGVCIISPKALAGLVFEGLRRQPVCVAVYPAHPLARERRVGLEQIAKERLIAFTRADYPEHHAWIAGLFAPLNRLPQIIEEHDSITSLIAAVESGRGVAVIAQPINGLASPRLKIRPLQPAPPPLAVGIAYCKKFRSTATENFIEAAKLANVG